MSHIRDFSWLFLEKKLDSLYACIKVKILNIILFIIILAGLRNIPAVRSTSRLIAAGVDRLKTRAYFINTLKYAVQFFTFPTLDYY